MTLEAFLPAYLGRQRWYAGDPPEKAVVLDEDEIVPGLRRLVVEAGGARYHVLVGFRSADPPPEFLHGQDHAVLGTVEGQVAFDAVLDSEYARALLARVAPDPEATHVRPMGVEQSNTSLIVDDRLVLKLFRRLQEGRNPDVEVPEALARAGFLHVAAPLATWRVDDTDLAVVQPFLAGGAEGWALALASLRDFYGGAAEHGSVDPAEAGGDFAGESCRLGEITGRMHVAMGEAFGVNDADPRTWAELIAAQLARLQPEDVDGPAAERLVGRMASLPDAGVAVRVHGDYHLGQVLRTDAGWFVLDFEGEPARSLEARRLPSSPFKDVAGMLRSFHYAAQVALSERDLLQVEAAAPLADAWEARNRGSFLDGYLSVDGIDALLPKDEAARHALLAAFELDKAVYEVLYERDHRPDLVEIPRSAVRRLLAG
jgi:maltokinase